MISKDTYDQYMIDIDRLMKKGEANCTPDELSQIRSMAEQCEAFEDRLLNRVHPCNDKDCPGEYRQDGYTQPNGQTYYECNECGNRISFP